MTTRSLHAAGHSLVAVALLCLLATPQPAQASQPCISCLKKPLKAMEKALREKNEKLFAKQWLPLGYQKNLVGGSGLAGRKVYRQGSRKGWFLKPNWKQLTSVDRAPPWIVPCDVWSWKKKRAVDKVWLVFGWQGKRSIVLGGGEKIEQVRALGLRWREKKPLAPAPKAKK